MLKSSDFVTHDLEHAFDDTVDDEPETVEAEGKTPTNSSNLAQTDIQYHLVLRKYFQLNPSLEFRCFVRNRKLLALCQRDLNHFEFLFNMQDKLRDRIQTFFDKQLKDTFPDPNFVFDVYVPPPHERVWLIDINPWAQRTDPLVFSWLELLTMPEPPDPQPEKAFSVSLQTGEISDISKDSSSGVSENEQPAPPGESETETDESDADEELFLPEVRLVKKDDPEAYGFTTPQYSAHKLPKDVVDASQGGGGQLREFAEQWKEILAKRQAEEAEDSEGD